MPVMFIDRLPLPNIQAYISISVVLLSCSLYYSITMTGDGDGDMFKNDVDPSQIIDGSITFGQKLRLVFMDNVILRRMYEIVYFMIQEPLCMATLINMAYCCLILFGKCIQKLVFGDLRVVEQQHLKDKFWNFVFYKFIFIFGVMNVKYLDEVLLWCSWFSVLGFLHLLVQLCKDRYEYISFSPTTPTLTHVRLFVLLFGIFSVASGLFAICVFIGLQTGLNTFCFMVAECTLVTLRALHVIFRYAIHLWDMKYDGVWERRVTYTYYSDLIFDLADNSVDLLHHLHMLLWGNILLSMASLVICMQLRYLFSEIQRRIRRHKNYLQVSKYMETNYPAATPEELESNSDDCSICWDRMESARKLPCGHLFHASCLRSWLEQVSTCPTCRMSLVTREDTNDSTVTDFNRNNPLAQDGAIHRPIVNHFTNHFFHFDGSRYVSWFPSFSVEVSHTSLLGDRFQVPAQNSQLDSMAHQVQQMFPHIPFNLILDDLRVTRSVEHTVDNLLDERFVPPTTSRFQGTLSRHDHSPLFINTPSEAPRELASSTSSVPEAASVSDSSVASTSQTTQTEDKNNYQRIEDSVLRTGGEGCRFSKSSRERETMLSKRKEELLKRARSLYVSRMKSDARGDTIHGSSRIDPSMPSSSST